MKTDTIRVIGFRVLVYAIIEFIIQRIIMLDFLKDILKVGLITIVQMLIAFSIGTAAAAMVCWYYGIPLWFSILGGIVVLGIALAIKSDSIFD